MKKKPAVHNTHAETLFVARLTEKSDTLKWGQVRFGAADSAPPIRRRRFGAGQFGAGHFGDGTIWRQNFFFRFVVL